MRPTTALAALLCLTLASPALATPGDAIADHVLGQKNFANSAPGFVDARALHDPSSLAVDRNSNPNRLYVADYDNSRVLGWRNAKNFKKGTPADLVIGQADFNASACNRGGAASNKTLCRPTGVSVDLDGALYVADNANNRVLRFASPFTSGVDFDQPAEAVFGQSSFTATLCNRSVSPSPASADTLCGPSGTAVDTNGNLYIADGLGGSFNSRVLEYDDPKAASGGTPGTSGAHGDTTADRVFGQADFTAASCNRATAQNPSSSPSFNTLCGVTDVSLDAAGDLLIVDTQNNRVLVFVNPLTDQVADQVFGQADFIHKDLGSGLDKLSFATGAVVDVAGNLWIADAFNGRVLEFNAPLLGSNGRSASRAFGTATFPSPKDFDFPADVDFDAFGNLYVADGMPPSNGLEGGYSRVLRLNDPLGTDAIPDGVLGQKGYSTSLPNRIDPRSLNVPRGIAFDRSVTPAHVYVVDYGANRVLGWADASAFADGQAADLVLGQPSFKQHYCNQSGSGAASAGASTLCGPYDVAVDSAGNVWVAEQDNNRVVGYAAPFNSGLVANQPAVRVLGQADFAGHFVNRTGIFNAPAGANTLSTPRSVAIDSADNLWVVDAGNDRVLLFKKPWTQDGNADLVLGQANLTSVVAASSPSADNIQSPFAVFVDGPGNVYVSDIGFSRVLLYIKPLAAGGGTPGTPGSKGDRTADRVFGKASLTDADAGQQGNFCNAFNGAAARSAQSLCSPADIAVDGTGSLWVADPGSNNNRVLRYDQPLTGDNVADAVIGAADFTSVPGSCGTAIRTASAFCLPNAVAIDPDGNLWVSEAGGNRVLVFDAN